MFVPLVQRKRNCVAAAIEISILGIYKNVLREVLLLFEEFLRVDRRFLLVSIPAGAVTGFIAS